MRKSTFRFCIVNALKGLSSTWIVQETEEGVLVGTKTADGHLRAILSPAVRTRLSVTLPPSLHRDTPLTQDFVLGEVRRHSADLPFDLTMSVMFLGDRSVQVRKAPVGRNGRRIVQIDAPGRGEAVEVSIGFSELPPAGLADVLPDLGTCLSVKAVQGNCFLYICQTIRPFPYLRLDGTLNTNRLYLSPTGLPGLYQPDPGFPGVLRIVQAAPGQINGL